MDAQNRLLSYGTCSYAYDANGELQSKTDNGEITSYQYDEFGNLRQVTLPDGRELSYAIDGLNRRIGKYIDGQLQGAWLYKDQLNPVAELDANGNVVSIFAYGEKSQVPSLMHKNGQTYRFITDHLGSVRQVVHVDSGQVVQALHYDAWGNVLQDSNPGFQPFGYAGGLHDRDTGLVRFGARDYDPVTGRWTAKDPIGFGGGDSNLYAYVGGDPVSNIDPFGLMTICINGKKTTDFSKYPEYIQVAADYIMEADSLESAAFAAHRVYSKMNEEYQRTGVWTKSLEARRNAEHYMFALYWADRAPGLAQVALLVVTPGYSAYKLTRDRPKNSPPSVEEVEAGYRGIIDSINLLPGGSLEFTNGECGCD